MTKTFCFLIIGLLISCKQQNKNTETVINTDTLKLDSITETKIYDSTSASEDEDCIFNNDYKQLTTEWLTELKINNFIWRADLNQALIPKGQDTVFLSQGGCYHFGISVELKLTNDNHSLADSALWMNRALKLAIEYQMDHYKQMLEEGRVRMAQDGDKRVTYLVEDEKESGNLVYDGIEFTQEGENKRIRISQYFN
jgi:hypothetical protein